MRFSSTLFNFLQLSSTPGGVENVLWDAFSSTLGGLENVVFSHFCDIEFLCLRVKSKVKSKGESISASCRLGRVFLQRTSLCRPQGQVFVGLKDKPVSAARTSLCRSQGQAFVGLKDKSLSASSRGGAENGVWDVFFFNFPPPQVV